MAKAKSFNLTLIRGPRRYVEGSYHEVPKSFVYHYTFKQIGNTLLVANVALPTQLKPKLTLSQLVAKFPNKTLDDLILENAKSKSGWTRATPEQSVQQSGGYYADNDGEYEFGLAVHPDTPIEQAVLHVLNNPLEFAIPSTSRFVGWCSRPTTSNMTMVQL